MKKNLLKSMIVAMAVVLCNLSAMAYDFLSGGIPYNITDETNKTVEVTYFGELSGNDYIYQNWKNYSGDLVIPEKVTYNETEYSVTAIGDYAVTGASAVTSLTLHDGITSIGEGAFATCNGLASVSLGNGIKSIKAEAFYRVDALTQITLPESVTEIGEDAFSGTGLTLIVVLSETPPTAHSLAFRGIEDATVKLPSADALNAYRNATGWKTFTNFTYGVVVTLNATSKQLYIKETTQLNASVNPSTESATITWVSSNTSVATVDKNGLVTAVGAGTANITATATISGQTPMSATCKVTVMSKYSLNGVYYNVTDESDKKMEITFAGASYNEIDDEYSGNMYIDNYSVYGYRAVSVGNSAFRDCDKLTKVTFRDNTIRSYGEYSFAGCSSLETFEMTTLKSSITASIEKHAFDGAGLAFIVITEGISSIAENAFANCSKLMTVVAESETPASAHASAFAGVPEDAVLYVPSGSKSDYKSAPGWSEFASIEEYKPATLGSRFVDYPSKLSINQGYQCEVENLGNIPQMYWESSDESILKVDQNGYVTAISKGEATITATLIDGSNKTTSQAITVDDNILVGDYIYDITSSENHLVTIAEAVNVSGEVVLPINVAIDGIQYTVTKLESQLFAYNEDITKVVIPEGVTEIPYSAFYGCTSLVDVDMPSTITSIVNQAFRGCTSLASVAISKNVKNIDFAAFSGCTSLTEIVVDNDNAFYFAEGGVLFQNYGGGQTSLFCYPAGKVGESYTVPSHVVAIANNAFESASNLTEIILHENITSIYTSAFRNCTGLIEITIPESVIWIENTLFYGCSSLKKVNLHNKVEEFFYGAFIDCTSLETITIPESVKSIGGSVFDGCTSLSTINVMNPTPITLGGSNVFRDIAEGAVVYVPTIEAETAYEADGNWTKYFDAEHIIYNDEFTGIENIVIENAKNSVIYNINGVRINKATIPGIYIINGKKVLVK